MFKIFVTRHASEQRGCNKPDCGEEMTEQAADKVRSRDWRKEL